MQTEYIIFPYRFFRRYNANKIIYFKSYMKTYIIKEKIIGF